MQTLVLFLSALFLASPADTVSAVGENLRFSVSYVWHGAATDVASATISLKEENLSGQDVLHVGLTARTAKFFDVFFKVREHFDSWVSAKDRRPVRFVRNTREGSYTAFNQYDYDYPAGKIHAVIQKRDREPQRLDIPLDGDCYDLTSLLLYLRTIDLEGAEEGKTLRIPYVFSTEKSSITLIYKGKAVKSLRGIGKVSVLKFGLTVADDDVFDLNSLAEIWVSDDENRIPVYFVAPLKVGAMSGRLRSYEGLKHPFAALQ